MDNKTTFIIFLSILFAISIGLGVQGALFFIFSAIIGALTLFSQPTGQIDAKISKFFLAIPIIIFFAGRLLPFALYGEHPLGYDTGFYKYSLTQERTYKFSDFHIVFSTESLGDKLLNKILIALGLDDDDILYRFYIFVGFLIGVMVYLLSRLYFGENAAFFSVFLYSISFAQFLFYWNFFWKNSVALFFALLVFYFIESGRRALCALSIPVIFFIFLTHKTTSFILLVTLAAYFLFRDSRKNMWIFPFIFFGAGIVAWMEIDALTQVAYQVFSGFNNDPFSLKSGIFIDTKEYIAINHAFWYIPFGLAAILESIRRKKINIVLVVGGVAALLIATKFIFYKRIFVFLDIALIIYFGPLFYMLIKKISAVASIHWKWFVPVVFAFPAAIFFLSVVLQHPLLAGSEIQNILRLQKIEPTMRVFIDNSYYTPWLYGFSGHRIIAPGWGDAPWTRETWKTYWNANAELKKIMLDDFQPPFIMYDNGSNPLLEGSDSCFIRTEGAYLFVCKQIAK